MTEIAVDDRLTVSLWLALLVFGIKLPLSFDSERIEETVMFKIGTLAFAVLVTGFLCSALVAQGQVAVGVEVGPAPICPYGYFDYAPYDCAPYGYYGPDWFVGGVFLGAGPWFHGPRGFYGHVDNRFDPHHGYVGPVPERGARRFSHFQGNEARDGRGNVGQAGHEGKAEHALPGYRGGGHAGGHGGGHH